MDKNLKIELVTEDEYQKMGNTILQLKEENHLLLEEVKHLKNKNFLLSAALDSQGEYIGD